MQEILHYNVPRLVVYQNTYMQGYRNDQFTGHVEDLGRYISGPWTMRKIHKLDGTPGGTVPVAISVDQASFNFFVCGWTDSIIILSNLYSSLFKYGPDLVPQPDLTENILTETHDDNPAVPTGHTRYTIDIIQNATWSDGTPLTAADVAFTYIYHYESAVYGNPAGSDLGDLIASYAPGPYRVILEFSTESYWHFSNFAFEYIIPQHIFNDNDGIGYNGWNTWNPVFNPTDPHVTSGPFIVTDYNEGEWYELTKNPLFYYLPPNPAPEISSVDDFSYVEGTTGNEIVWEASDDNPLTYNIFKEDVLIESEVWDGSNVIENVDGLSIGTYNYSLYLLDYSTNLVISSTIVTVFPESTTSSTTSTSGNPLELNPLASMISVGSIGVIIVVAVLIWKSKQL